MTNLTPVQINDLAQVLINTLDEDDVALFLGLATGDDLYVDYIGERPPLAKLIRILVKELDREGTLPLFLRVVYARRPNKADVLAYLKARFPGVEIPIPPGAPLELQNAGTPVPAAVTNSSAPGLQRNIRPLLGDFDAMVWLDNSRKAISRVCRIESDRVALGTGFLVGPDLAPVKIAFDTQAVIGEVFGGLRLRYRTNTNHGSSGSPCFALDWRLAALHHLGDPALGTPVFNQGIPIALIRADLQARGHGALLTSPPG